MPKCATIKVKQKCLLVQVADSQAKYKPVTSKIQNVTNLRWVQKTSLILRCRYVWILDQFLPLWASSNICLNVKFFPGIYTVLIKNITVIIIMQENLFAHI